MDISSLFTQNEAIFYGLRASVLAGALCLFAIALGSWRRSGRRDMQRLFDELDQSRGEARALSGMAEQLSGQIRALQARFEDRQQLAAASTGGAQRGYDLALQMARNGAAPEEIISASGVTRHEAALLTRLHNPSSRQT
jgi:Protein of unknown function (DUF2802)